MNGYRLYYPGRDVYEAEFDDVEQAITEARRLSMIDGRTVTVCDCLGWIIDEITEDKMDVSEFIGTDKYRGKAVRDIVVHDDEVIIKFLDYDMIIIKLRYSAGEAYLAVEEY